MYKNMNATATAALTCDWTRRAPAMMAMQMAHPALEKMADYLRPSRSRYQYGGHEKTAYCVKATEARMSDMELVKPRYFSRMYAK